MKPKRLILKRKRLIFALCSMCLMASLTVAGANSYALEMKEDKTIIHPERLGYNENSTLEDVLKVLPELVSRAEGSAIANYSVQLDDKDVGDAKDVVLKQTRLVEIECIEVSNSPTVSEQVNGHGGTINVKLRHPEEGTHGAATLGVSTEWYVQPALYLTHKKDKFELRSTVLLEYDALNGTTDRESLRKRSTEDPHRTMFLEKERQHSDVLNQTVKLDMQYRFNERNTLRVWALENGALQWGKGNTEAESHTALTVDTVFYFRFGKNDKRVNNKNIYVSALAEYKHTYRTGGELEINAGYNFHPQSSFSTMHATGSYFSGNRDTYDRSITKLHEFTGKVSSNHVIPLPDTDHHLEMKIGANASYSDALSQYSDSVWWTIDAPALLAQTHGRVRETYASPFVEWKYAWQGLSVQAGVRYQYYRRDYQLDQSYESIDSFHPEDMDEASAPVTQNHDVTASLNVNYAINSQHRLRLMTARNLIRPSNLQSYPRFAIDWSSMTAYEQSEVDNAHTYNVELDYIFDWEENGHNIFLNAGLTYIHSRELIESLSERWDYSPDIQIVQFYNGGKNNIGTGELSLCYRYGGFSMSFCSNIFFSKNRFYYNLSLSPVYAFRKEWYLAGHVMYNSKVETGQSYLGDCFYAQLRLHKNIGNWMVYLELDDIFGYVTTDKTVYSENEYMQTKYDLYKRAFAAGFTYKF